MRTPSDKANGLLDLLHKGLHLHAERTTALALGDRSKYVGLSDIGRALECPRAALLNKIGSSGKSVLCLVNGQYPELEKIQISVAIGHPL